MRISEKHEYDTKRNAAYDDFASILDEGKSSRFKPLIIVTLVVLMATGGLLYLVPRLNGNNKAADSSIINAPNSNTEAQELAKFSACIKNIETANPTPDASDAEFYPKLIASYDAQLSCYDQYPNTGMAGNRSSVESARQGAIDSAGAYKSTYLANGGSYTYKPSNSYTNPTTGCSYSLSESEYIKCTDTYNAQHKTSVSTRLPAPTQGATTNTQPQNTIDTAWCGAKKTEVNQLYSDYIAKRDAADAVSTELSKVDHLLPVGGGLTQTQIDKWRASERRRLQSQLTSLQAIANEALQKYNAAKSEMTSRSCG